MSAAAPGPLGGLLAIEFGQLIAGPYVGTLLGDFGADVIKVEAPPHGDPMRVWGRKHEGRGLWWSVLARNKRSISLNLRTPRGRELAAALCARADVVVENFRPGTMERWGLGPADVHAANPGCVYARVSGYGQTGRYRDRPGFAAGGEAIGGLRAINGHSGQAPPRYGISLGDSLAGQSAFQGILLALYARAVKGASGQVVDAAIADACFALLEATVPEYDKTGHVRTPSGTRLAGIAPSNVFRSSDGRWVVIAANHDTLWRRLAAAMGRPELGDDPRFADFEARGRHEDLLDELISAWAAERTAAELDALLDSAGVVSAPVNTVEDVFADPWFRERGLIVEVEDEAHGRLAVPGVVPRLERTPGAVRQPARWTVGADNADVLGGLLGLGADELAALAADGVT
jgi:crotonobetainyl-CoA:carnitine CoA-transferase CaiB-like acyl-CoA transferase